ncbi:hypothetical protein M0802_013854, partial [Mischocyttarus mexicanus]
MQPRNLLADVRKLFWKLQEHRTPLKACVLIEGTIKTEKKKKKKKEEEEEEYRRLRGPVVVSGPGSIARQQPGSRCECLWAPQRRQSRRRTSRDKTLSTNRVELQWHTGQHHARITATEDPDYLGPSSSPEPAQPAAVPGIVVASVIVVVIVTVTVAVVTV